MDIPSGGESATLSPLKRALLAIESMQKKLDAYERSVVEPIAVIGIGCRFPGGNTPKGFWNMLASGTDTITEVPADRWDIDAFYHPDPTHPGTMVTRWGGFLPDVDLFDASFFGISPREAVQMDPQQRLLLEVVWEALEDAGKIPFQLRGTQTGVYVGISSYDYVKLSYEGVDAFDTYVNTSAPCILPGRLSYFFDFRGPCFPVDTACSSSLLTVHLACHGLRSRECNLAVAGGVNLILVPELSIAFSKIGMMAPDGRCKTFDARANGYVRGEGCGVVILKRLSDALNDNDSVYAVIRGSATNHDGRSVGLMAPNMQAQQAVLRQALHNAGVESSQIGYIEAHGTGTPLGDPIEIEALTSVYGRRRSDASTCFVGSVKTNVGHLEAAAGIAGLIKTVLALRHEAIPPHLHFHQLNPNISFNGTPFTIPTELTPWLSGEMHRYAGVSSFGFSGTNVHVVLEEAPQVGRPHVAAPEVPAATSLLLPVSARSPEACRVLASSYLDLLRDEGEDTGPALSDLCYTASVRRTHFHHRLYAAGRSRTELAHSLEKALREPPDTVLRPEDKASVTKPYTVFVFSGQGTQWRGMGLLLAKQEPVFRSHLEACDVVLAKHASWSLFSEISADKPDARLHETEVAQPVLCAFQIALVALLRSWGIEPDAVVGHSAGEIAATHTAGILDLEEAMFLACHRGRLMQTTAGQGKMIAISLPEEDAEKLVPECHSNLTIAAVNSPESTVLSGTSQAIDTLIQMLVERGITHHLLDVDLAAHSTLMEPLRDDLKTLLHDLRPRSGTIPLLSSMTGSRVDGSLLNGSYWATQMRNPVRFAAAVKQISAAEHPAFLEIGPHPVLGGSIIESLKYVGKQALILCSMRRGSGGRDVLLEAVGELYRNSTNLRWKAFYPEEGNVVPLPSYPWQREPYWVTSKTTNLSTGSKRSESDILDGLLYTIEWQSVEGLEPMIKPAPFEQSGQWIIFSDRQGFAGLIAKRLTEIGETCFQIYPAPNYQKVDSGQFGVDPANSEEIRELINRLMSLAPDIRGVIYLWSLDLPLTDELTPEALESAISQNVVNIALTVQTLKKQDKGNTPRIWVVTKGAQCICEDEAVPGAIQSPLWGFGKTCSLELPEYWGGLIDLDPVSTDERTVDHFINTVLHSKENEIAFRDDKRYVPRLVPFRHPEQHHLSFDPDAAYLVTGGLTGIGYEIARWMASEGARHLILLGRTQLPPRESWDDPAFPAGIQNRIDNIRKLEKDGIMVHAPSVDIADGTQVTAFFDTFVRPHHIRIKGVIHAAAVWEDFDGESSLRALVLLSGREISMVARPKLTGTWLLSRLIQKSPIEFVVFISSMASIIGSVGWGKYAAAHAFLDAYAHYLRAKGYPATSLNLGPVANVGYSISSQGIQMSTFWEMHGVKHLSIEQVRATITRFTGRSITQIGVMNIDWQLLLQSLPQGNTFSWARNLVDEIAETNESSDARRQVFVDSILNLPLQKRQEKIEQLLLDRIAGVLRMPVDKIDVRQSLLELGFDSLAAIELRSHVHQTTGVLLPIMQFFDHPGISDLAAYVLDKLKADDETSSVSDNEVWIEGIL